jgi:ectoine hydroxylase-related dioxygenase (phytanoyl-CoA dioxygenase family)
MGDLRYNKADLVGHRTLMGHAMKTDLTQNQIDFYRQNGFIVIDGFLSADELEHWRTVVTRGVEERGGVKFPGQAVKTGEDDKINPDADYFGNVFDQIVNLWQTSADVKELMFDERIGRMAGQLAGVSGIRIWHDQTLYKRPWANPTAWHLDTPFWSFYSRDALSIWVALDDATLENGCLFFLPGTHREATFENPGITKNMNAIFTMYPQFARIKSMAAPMKAGSCSFHNGLCVHGANANMTPGFRRAMTCAYMPDGSTFNGIKNILTDEQVARLKPGDLMNDDAQNPLIYSSKRSSVPV